MWGGGGCGERTGHISAPLRLHPGSQERGRVRCRYHFEEKGGLAASGMGKDGVGTTLAATRKPHTMDSARGISQGSWEQLLFMCN